MSNYKSEFIKDIGRTDKQLLESESKDVKGEISINIVKDRNISFNEKVNYHDLLKTNHIGCLTAMYDITKIISKNKIFMSEMRSRQDLSLWLKILKSIEFGYGINKVLGSYRIRRESISSNKIKVIYYQWKLYRDIEELSFSKSIYFLIFYLYFGIIKYFKQLF